MNDAVVAEIDLYMKVLGRRYEKSLHDKGSLDDPITNRITTLLVAANRIGDAIDNREYDLPFPRSGIDPVWILLADAMLPFRSPTNR